MDPSGVCGLTFDTQYHLVPLTVGLVNNLNEGQCHRNVCVLILRRNGYILCTFILCSYVSCTYVFFVVLCSYDMLVGAVVMIVILLFSNCNQDLSSSKCV